MHTCFVPLLPSSIIWYWQKVVAAHVARTIDTGAEIKSSVKEGEYSSKRPAYLDYIGAVQLCN